MGIVQILGLLEFRVPLKCKKEVLGSTIPISVKGISGNIFFPKYPPDSGENLGALIPPDTAKTWKRGDELIHWGRVYTYPSGASFVERVLLEFSCPAENLSESCQIIFDNINAWLRLFNQYVRLFSSENRESNIKIKEQKSHLEMFRITDSGISSVSDTSPIELIGRFSRGDNALNLNDYIESCNYSSLGQPPRTEYLFMLDAYQAKEDSDHRKSIIEAATSLEICLTERIKKEFYDKSISFGIGLLKKFRMLSGRFDLMKLLGIDLPTADYKEKIIEPRNSVIHEATLPDIHETNRFLQEVEKYLHEFSRTYNP